MRDTLEKSIVCFVVLLCMLVTAAAQKESTVAKRTLIFSAIRGTISRPVAVTLAANEKLLGFTGDNAGFKIISQNNREATIAFAPAPNFTGIAKTTLQVKNAAGKITDEIRVTGLSTKGLEGDNEAPLSTIIDALGYRTDCGWSTLANNCLPALQGEELAAQQFVKAGAKDVEMIPVAKYSPDFQLPFGYYTTSGSAPATHPVGVLSTKTSYPEHQILFPALASGGTTFNPGKNAFGFYATGANHTAYSEDQWNMLLHPTHAVHATRIYPLKDEQG